MTNALLTKVLQRHGQFWPVTASKPRILEENDSLSAEPMAAYCNFVRDGLSDLQIERLTRQGGQA